MEKINLKQKFSLFQDRGSPKIIGELNGQYVKLVKVKGVFQWHHHDSEDELFLVVKGKFTMRLKDGDIVVHVPATVVTTARKMTLKLSEHYAFKQQWEEIEKSLSSLRFA